MSRIKVLHIINTLNSGGAERLIVDSFSYYNKFDIDVDLLVLKKSITPFISELKEKFDGNIYELSEGSLYSPMHMFRISKYAKKYDLLHVHLFPSLYWVVLTNLIFRCGNPIFYTEHSMTNRRRENFILKFFDKIIYKKIEFIGCISKGVYEGTVKYLDRRKGIGIINNGIDLNRFKYAKKSESMFFSGNDFILIQVSSFRIQKDHETLVRSLILLPNSVKLLLVGDGPLKRKIHRLVRELKLEERVKFLGIRKDVPDLMTNANIVVLSSNYEGFGLSAVEGMATGRPVIVSNIKGLDEVAEEAGILFEKGNVKQLAKHILRLKNDQSFYNEIAAKCSNRAERYSIENMVKEYSEKYKDFFRI